ncbi:MAG: Mur ligase protein [Patescibacteria group bacterium]|nr:Mur ligase protein [Patescibacteria group bacterium]
MKAIFLRILHFLARKVVEKHRPFIVGITGTVGKTTTTHFVYDFLHSLYGETVYMSPHNYNGEYGLPFTILGVRSPYSNPFLWLWVFVRGFFRLFDRKYPKYLVLEYGIDHPGEMASLLAVAKPDVGIILNVSKNHVANFRSFQDYAAEKLLLADVCGRCIYNADDKVVSEGMSESAKARAVSFSAKKKTADVHVRSVSAKIDGITFDVCFGEACATATFPVVGSFQAYNLLPVFALGIEMGRDLHDIVTHLSDVHPQKGRGSVLKGVKESVIVDGTYNGGFAAMSAGIEYLSELPEEYARVFFLGDMRELGPDSEAMHGEIAEKILAANPDTVVLVGDEMRKYVFPSLSEALGEKVFCFSSSRVAGSKVRESVLAIQKPCVIFAKGSQTNIYLEEGIKEFLFDLRDIDKLCRQSPRWMKIKAHFFDTICAKD